MATEGVTAGWQFLEDGEEMRAGGHRLLFQLLEPEVHLEETPESLGAYNAFEDAGRRRVKARHEPAAVCQLVAEDVATWGQLLGAYLESPATADPFYGRDWPNDSSAVKREEDSRGA